MKNKIIYILLLKLNLLFFNILIINVFSKLYPLSSYYFLTPIPDIIAILYILYFNAIISANLINFLPNPLC